MFNSQVVKDRNGQHYIIRLRHQGHQNLAIQPEKFYSAQASYQFVTTLQTPFGLWQNIASANSFFSLQRWQNTNPSLSIEHYAAQVLVQGFVEVYKTADIQQFKQQIKQTRFKDKLGRGYQFQPASNLLLNNSADIKIINNERAAAQFLSHLNLSQQSLNELSQSLDLNKGSSALSELKAAIIDGRVVITATPEAKKPSSNTEYVEQTVRATDPAPAAPSKPVETAPENNTRADNGSADALMKAAEEGTPFCEECEKAKSAA